MRGESFIHFFAYSTRRCLMLHFFPISRTSADILNGTGRSLGNLQRIGRVTSLHSAACLASFKRRSRSSDAPCDKGLNVSHFARMQFPRLQTATSCACKNACQLFQDQPTFAQRSRIATFFSNASRVRGHRLRGVWAEHASHRLRERRQGGGHVIRRNQVCESASCVAT
jgi:hypothetical protein